MSNFREQPLDQEDQDSIIYDARAGDLESLKEIFTELVHPKLLLTCFQSYTKSTPLHMACANGHLEVVKYLLDLIKSVKEIGSDKLKEWINLKNESGNTALHWACLNGQLETVEYLCDCCDADPFIKNNADHDAIFEAENNGKDDIETYFLKKYDVQPEDDEEGDDKKKEEEEEGEGEGKDKNNNGKENILDTVKVTEGTEIENVTKEAHEAMADLTLKED